MHTTDPSTPRQRPFSGTTLRHAFGPGFQLHAATDAALSLAADRCHHHAGRPATPR